ncbi:amidohydrolase family protein [Rheinheimera sp. 4Y26]|uniref:amidohydrolase family protein n=1 Tax=Rheinheimera sp. 4Y26 TaxID=2977811 RepID=UPI0021B096E1|nr:amidohydrolase family protein [Rheinheimera sp. 4Y26]MCT6701327.1 amidohydrolase family protein [Rheinheimera sp. 4Y26]
MNLNKSLISLLIAAAVSPALAHDIVPGAKQTAPVLLTDATIHTATKGVLENADLLMVDGKIAAMGVDLAAPEGAKVVSLQGKHLYPGLIALANQLGLIEIEAVRATDDTSEVTDTNPDIRARIAYNADSEVIPTVRSNGFSYSLVYPKGRALMGQSSLMQLDAWTWQDATVTDAVGLHINWPSTSTVANWWNHKKPEEMAKENAKALQKLKDYFVQAKAYADAEAAGLNKGVDSRWQAMIPVFKGQRPLFVHADDLRQIKQAMELAKQYQLKLVIVGGRDSWRMANELAAANVAVVFTAPYGIPERDDEANNTAFQTPALLQKAGVKFALSLDGYWDTRNVVFGAGQAISYGLTREQALAAVTINAAQIAGVADKIGSLEVGKAATVVVSDGDIFDYLTHKVSAMWIDGREVTLNDRNKQLHHKYSQKPAI